MTDVQSRVARCFLNVFPDLKENDVHRAAQASLPQWDSVAHVTLLSALAEEFQFELEDEAFETMTSYLLVVDFLEDRVAGN